MKYQELKMEYTTLGRTGLTTSVIGLGCGGHSRLGKSTGNTRKESIEIVKSAIELGINFIDTAEAYGTEDIVGDAIIGRDRNQLIISTKKTITNNDKLITAEHVKAGLEDSLKRLKTDYIDIYHLHGVSPEKYYYLESEIVPVLEKMQDQGKIRFLGITEIFELDPGHKMLQKALANCCWDVVMVGYNILNQSARKLVFQQTQKENIGVLGMFAVRRAFSRPERLKELLADLADQNLIDLNLINMANPLGFLVKEDGACSIPDAAYRFCHYEPGIDVVLSGTGNLEHLHANIRSILSPPLPETDIGNLRALFAKVDSVSGS